MANVKLNVAVNALDAAAELTGTDKLLLSQGTGDNDAKKVDLSVVKAYIGTGAASLPYISNSSTIELSKSDLNTAYPTAQQSQVVLVAAAFVKYIKLDNSGTGNWDTQPLNLVS